MNILTTKNLESLRLREYMSNISRSGYALVLKPIENHNINHIFYVELLESLDETYLVGLKRHLTQNWNLIAKKIEDIPVSTELDMLDLCSFLVEDVNRIYFFIENVFFYFFPNN